MESLDGDFFLFNRCPIPDAMEGQAMLSMLYDVEDLKILPRAGGLYDQPAAFVAVLRYYRGVRGKIDKLLTAAASAARGGK